MQFDETTKQKIFAAFPFLARSSAEMQQQFWAAVSLAHLSEGQFICLEGNQCTHLALVLNGRARVYKLGESGREITLYRIEPSESCILTASCILSNIAFPAFAVAESDIEAVLIPSALLQQWMGQHEAWRNYVFQLLSERLGAIIVVIEEVAFRRVDSRLAEYLLHLQESVGNLIEKTHQEIAVDLGTSREVVSRILKDFEREGAVTLARGHLTIDQPALLTHKRN